MYQYIRHARDIRLLSVRVVADCWWIICARVGREGAGTTLRTQSMQTFDTCNSPTLHIKRTTNVWPVRQVPRATAVTVT